MSENEEEIEFTEEKPQKVEITHKIVKEEKKENKNPETEEEKTKIENESLKTVIGLIAEKEFNEKRREVSKALGLDEETIKTAEDLKAYQRLLSKQQAEKSFGKKNPSGGVPLSNEQTGDDRYFDPTLPLRYREYSSHEEMILDLERTAKRVRNSRSSKRGRTSSVSVMEKEFKRP